MSGGEAPERDVKDFDFIQLCKFRVSPSGQEISTQRGKHLACSSQYGLLIFATKQGFSVVRTSQLQAIDEAQGKERNKVIIEDIPLEVKVDLSTPALCVDVSGDGNYLAVVVRDMGQLSVLFYDVRSFAAKDSSPAPFAKSRVNASPSAVVLDLSWNPAVFTMLAICTSDGNVELVDVTDNPKMLAALPAAAGATCFCWSPKGKQLLVGKKDGSLAQYDHALTEKKQWPYPGGKDSAPHAVVDVVWQSTYIFLAAYISHGADAGEQPVVIMTLSNKENNTTHINFEDICFGNGEERQHQYFFHLVQKWDVILMSSGNATETTIVGKNLDDKTRWEHWNLEDCSRAELPLTSDQSDSFPMGLAVDYSPQKAVVLSESKQLPPCPVMYLLSTDGLLIGFHLSYTHKDAPPATIPVQPLSAAGARKGVAGAAPAALPDSGPGLVETPKAASSAMPTPVQPSSVLPKPAQATTTTSLVPPFASPSAPAPTSTPQLFGRFSTPTTNTTGPSFQFAGLQGPPVSGTANQKPQPLFQTPSSTTENQPRSGSFGFGAPSTTPPSSAFAFVAPPFSSTPATSGQAKPASLPQPSAGTFPFSQISATQSQPQPSAVPALTTAPAATSSSLTAALTGKVSTAPSIFGTPAAPATAKSVSGMTPNLFGMKEEGTKPGPGLAQSVPPPVGALASGQPRAPSTSAFTSRPLLVGPGQAGQMSTNSASVQPSLTPGNGLVSGSTVRAVSPGPGGIQTGLPKPAMAAAAQPSIPSVTTGQAVGSFESQKSIEETVDSAFTQNIIEEIADFERELKELKIRSRREVKTVGTREEMHSMRQDTEKMINFTQEIKVTTKDQLKEAQEQKTLCFDLFAMAEECKSKQERDLDPHYHSLLQNRVLDPVSSQKLKNLQQMAQALEQSVVDVDRVLDAEWEEHLAKKKKEERMCTPTGDTIYKTIRNNHILIASQRQQLEKVEEQLRNLKLYSKTNNRPLQSINMLNRENMSPLQTQQKPEKTLISSVTNGMTPEKVAKLREILSHRKVPRIKSTAPANLTMSRIVSQTPVRTPGATPSPQQQQQQQLQQHQRKHQLQQEQLQTPTGPPQSQLAPPQGQLRLQKGQSQPDICLHPSVTQPGVQQLGGQTIPVLGRGQRPVSNAPTAFSGVAYFKQPPASGAVTKAEIAGIGKPSVLSGGVPSPAAVTNAVSGTPGAKSPVSPVRILQFGVGATAGLPATGQSIGGQPVAQLVQPPQTPQMPPPPYAKPSSMAGYYEDVTATETDDTNDEDDDYDEEENGYDDEEEEEEDEEETGFMGMGQSLSAVLSRSENHAAQISAMSQILNQRLAEAALAQGTTGISTGTPTALSSGGGGAGGFVFGGGASASGGGLFKLPQVGTGGPNAEAFNPVKSGAQTSATPQAPQAVVVTTSSQGASKDLFGTKTIPTTTMGTSGTPIDLTLDNGVPKSGSAAPIFGAPKLSGVTTASGIFAPSKAATTTTAGGVPASGPAAAATTSVFGQNSTTGFSFGGSAVFGQKPGLVPTAGGQGSVFGAMATPSKSMGFADLGAGPATTAGKDRKEDVAVTSAARSPGQSAAPQSSLPSYTAAVSPASTTATTATTTAVAAAAGNFSFTQAAASSNSTLFGGNKPATSTPSNNLFGGVSSTSPTSGGTPSVFGGKSPTEGSKFSFGTAPATSASTAAGFSFGTPPASTATTTTSPVFGATTTVATAAMAASATVAPPPTPTDNGKLNGSESVAPDSTTSVQSVSATVTDVSNVSSATNSAVSSTNTTSQDSSATAVSSAPPSTTASSLFGTAGTASTSSSFVFGRTSSANSATVAFSTTTASGEDSVKITDASSTKPFASISGFTQPSATAFGSPATSGPTSAFGAKPDASTSVFGSGGGDGATATPVFGGTTTSSAPTSGFGTSSSTSAGGPFGTASTTSSGFGSAGGSLFGSTATTTSVAAGTGVFGGAGGATPTSATAGGGLFGSGSSSGSLFGSGASKTQPGSVFGQPTTTAGFGFGSAAPTSSVFGQPASSSSTTSSLFGQSSGTTGTSLFGQPSSTSSTSTLFGQTSNTMATSKPFGQPSAFGQQPASSSSGLFGFGGLGGKPSEEKANQNVFGTPQVFGNAATQSSSLFGSGGSRTFGGSGSTSFSSSPGSGGFSSGAGGVASSGFGVSTNSQTSTGFGGASAFGSAAGFSGAGAFGSRSASGFGSSPAFGGAPAFGSSPSFSNPSGPSTSFGSSPGGGFSSFANAAAPSFGQLAQASPSTSAFGGGSGSAGGGGGFGSSQAAPFGGGFGSSQPQPSFGGSVFGQASSSSGFGGGQQPGGFGASPSFGGNPAFSSYRG